MWRFHQRGRTAQPELDAACLNRLAERRSRGLRASLPTFQTSNSGIEEGSKLCVVTIGLGDQARLAAAFFIKPPRAGVGHPDLNRPQTSLSQGVAALSNAL